MPNITDKEKALLLKLHNSLPVKIPNPGIVEFLEESRTIPPETSPENYGHFRISKTPHLKEPLEVCHPDHPAKYIAIMKSVQSAVTVTVAEGAMAYMIEHKYGSILYLITNKQVLRVRSSSAIDVMIDWVKGLADRVKPISSRMARKTADTTYYKEFEGGIKVFLTSYFSIGDLKSNTFSFIVQDEWDEAPAELADQGDIAGIIEGRTMGVSQYKILSIGTPTRMETSRMYAAYIDGDQRRYFCSCLYCGHMQPLILKQKGQKGGLTFRAEMNKETERKILIPDTVRYICRECEKAIYEYEKEGFLSTGIWKPTYSDLKDCLFSGPKYHPKSDYHVSFHCPGTISSFLTWKRFCQRFLETKFGDDLLLYKDFIINFEGKPWGRVESGANWHEIKELAHDYVLGEIPENKNLRLFGGVDIQKDRTELAVIGVGPGLEVWLVDYQVFFGSTTDLSSPAWTELEKFCVNFDGLELVGVDSGYDPKSAFFRNKDWADKGNIVYSFAAKNAWLFRAIKGAGDFGGSDIVVPKRIRNNILKTRYDIQTPILKEILYRTITESEGPNVVHLPKRANIGGKIVSLPDHYWQSLMAERYQEISPGKMGWKKIYERNEVLDTIIYAISMVYLTGLHRWDNIAWETYKKSLTNE